MAEIDRVLSDLTLTPKEREVLNLLLKGWKNSVIAGMLHCQPRTIAQDVYRVCDKFGDNNTINFKGKDKRVALVIACLKMQQRSEVKAD